MKKRNKTEETSRAHQDELTMVIRAGTRKLIAQALDAEVTELLATVGEQHDPNGRARVVRNGYQPEREIQTGIGPVTVQVPKVRSRQGQAVRFHSALVPPYVRKSRSLETALP
jgi:putative transposase